MAKKSFYLYLRSSFQSFSSQIFQRVLSTCCILPPSHTKHLVSRQAEKAPLFYSRRSAPILFCLTLFSTPPLFTPCAKRRLRERSRRRLFRPLPPGIFQSEVRRVYPCLPYSPKCLQPISLCVFSPRTHTGTAPESGPKRRPGSV